MRWEYAFVFCLIIIFVCWFFYQEKSLEAITEEEKVQFEVGIENFSSNKNNDNLLLNEKWRDEFFNKEDFSSSSQDAYTFYHDQLHKDPLTRNPTSRNYHSKSPLPRNYQFESPLPRNYQSKSLLSRNYKSKEPKYKFEKLRKKEELSPLRGDYVDENFSRKKEYIDDFFPRKKEYMRKSEDSEESEKSEESNGSGEEESGFDSEDNEKSESENVSEGEEDSEEEEDSEVSKGEDSDEESEEEDSEEINGEEDSENGEEITENMKNEEENNTQRGNEIKIIQWSDANKSHGERLCSQILSNITGLEYTQVRIEQLKNPKTGKALEIDCYNPEAKIGLEYQGPQHYHYPNWTDCTLQAFKEQVGRDEYKRNKCHALGIKLIEVPYNVKQENLEAYISQKLKDLGVKIKVTNHKLRK